MASITGTNGRRGSSRRGSRSSEYQQSAQNHNRDHCPSSVAGPYVSVAVRVLESGAGPMSLAAMCCTCQDAWNWLSSAVERRSPPGWTPWILATVLTSLVSILSVLWFLMDVVWLYSQLCSLTIPFFALMSGYLLLALGFRHSWTPTGIYLTFCGSVVGETVGFFLSSALSTTSSSSSSTDDCQVKSCCCKEGKTKLALVK